MPSRWTPKIHFVLIFLAHSLGAMCVLSVLASGPILILAFDLTAMQVGGLASAYSATLAIASLPAGILVDRIGTRAALTLSALIMSAGMLWVASSQHFVSLCIGMAISGAGYGLINPAAGRAVLLWFSPRWRGTLMGIKQTGVPVGGAVGTGLAGLGHIYGWQTGVLSVAFISCLLTIFFFYFLPKQENNSHINNSINLLSGLSRVFKTPYLTRANLASGLTNGGQFTLWAFLAETLRQSASFTAATIALSMALLQLGTFFGRLFWGIANDQLFSQHTITTLRYLSIVAIIGSSILWMFNSNAPWIVAPLVAFILGFSICSATGIHVALTISLAPKPFVGAAIGYTMLTTNLGGVILPLVFGVILDYLGTDFFAISLIFMMLLVLWLINFKQPKNA